jgi:hypothetical protein
MVIAKPVTIGNYLHFSALADLCKEMSTKSNDNVAAAGLDWPHRGTRRCHPETGF